MSEFNLVPVILSIITYDDIEPWDEVRVNVIERLHKEAFSQRVFLDLST
jgi:hypothetical protein